MKAQVGHAARDVEERHYLDLHLVDASQSSQAVWDILTGKKELNQPKLQEEVLPLAAGAELQQVVPIVAPVVKIRSAKAITQRISTTQVFKSTALEIGAGDGVRTHDLRLGKPTLYH